MPLSMRKAVAAALATTLVTGAAAQASPQAAAIKAAQLRLRPILMTSLAFILGVSPLVFSTGAGFEQRVAIGTAVFAGMIGVTILGLILTPPFYVATRRLSRLAPKLRLRGPRVAPAE